MNAKHPRTSSICVIQACDVCISSACPHLRLYLYISLSNEGFCTWPDTSSRSKKVVHWSLQQSVVSCREDSGSVAVVSIIPVSVAQMAAPETGSPMQESPFAPLPLLHHFCFHLIYHSALCYKLHYFRRFSCPELTDLLMFKQKIRAWAEQFL